MKPVANATVTFPVGRTYHSLQGTGDWVGIPIRLKGAEGVEIHTKWRVEMRDRKTGQRMPVLIPDAVSAHDAIKDAIRRAERFFPGRNWKPSCAVRTL